MVLCYKLGVYLTDARKLYRCKLTLRKCTLMVSNIISCLWLHLIVSSLVVYPASPRFAECNSFPFMKATIYCRHNLHQNGSPTGDKTFYFRRSSHLNCNVKCSNCFYRRPNYSTQPLISLKTSRIVSGSYIMFSKKHPVSLSRQYEINTSHKSKYKVFCYQRCCLSSFLLYTDWFQFY